MSVKVRNSTDIYYSLSNATSEFLYNSIYSIVVAGDTIRVVYGGGTDSTPVYENPNYYYNGFNGFRI